MPIQVAVRYKAYVFSGWIAGIAGSNPAKGTHVRLFCLLCVVKVAVSARGGLLV